ncbi:MAG: M20/M25/M40 family metallo-hydrolase [Pyrinomonadaceae bacterium]|nr:M20/M25/M40 family metallo-hydrolase [Sphingobacteriaceae bacterium]
MNKTLLLLISFFLSSCVVKKLDTNIPSSDVERIVRTLSSDEMQGRAIFTPGIEKAAKFIEEEFRGIGLKPLAENNSFRQEFFMTGIKPFSVDLKINGAKINNDQVMVISDSENLKWVNSTDAEIHYIKAGDSFMIRFGSIMALNKPVMVYVDEEFRDAFNRVRDHYHGYRVVNTLSKHAGAVFVIGAFNSFNFEFKFANNLSPQSLFNVVGIIPGKSKPNEYVIFSGHYDHLGIIDAVDGDSIANGADDDASGVSAVISLAKYYKKVNNNERTIICAAFTGEESGMLGSKYFSQKLDPNAVVAMFNIEMIGKESKFGKNAAFITGYDTSDFGQILQKNLAGTGFTFHPDPYTEQQLFYRSDNATLAELGVPAHTISSDQIDIDKFYHTVNDEVETLDVQNITSIIKAIALSSKSIVAGVDTPKRVEPVGRGTK